MIRPTLIALSMMSAASVFAKGPEPRRSLGQRLSLGVRVEPLGLLLESETTVRWRLGTDGDFLTGSAHVDLGAFVSITPVQLQIGGTVEIEPVAFFVARARALRLQWFGTFGTLESFESLSADWSPQRLAELEDADSGQAEHGSQLELEGQLRGAIGPLVATATIRPTWISSSMRDPYYEPYADLLLAPDDFVIFANAMVAWRFSDDLLAGVRWDLNDPDAVDGDATRHTLGAVFHGVWPLGDTGPDLGVDAIAGVYLADRYRSGVPFVAAGVTLAWRLGL